MAGNVGVGAVLEPKSRLIIGANDNLSAADLVATRSDQTEGVRLTCQLGQI